MTFGSLFAGIGGFDLGLERAGMTCKWQVEIDPFCRKVLTKHWPHVRRYEDVRTVHGQAAHVADADCVRCEGIQGNASRMAREKSAQEGRESKAWVTSSAVISSGLGDDGERCDGCLPAVDLLCGGFPCQPHSMAGRRKGAADERNLWGEFFRLIRQVRPQWVLAENVPGLLSTDAGRFFGGVLRDLAQIGYDAEWDCLPASAFGANHRRDRVWVVAYPNIQGLEGWDSTIMQEHASEWPTGAGGASMAYSNDQGQSGRSVYASARVFMPQPLGRDEWWRTEPDVGRVAHGVPARVDRLRGLGNAVVPQIAEWLGRRVLEAAQ